MKNIVTRAWIARAVAALGALLAAGGVLAAGASIPIERWPAERGRDLVSLQNGARLFANYCMGCHSANLVRWNRLQDIGLTDAQIREFLIFGNQKVGDPMKIAMAPADAKTWFGKVPPDLSVITRARTSFDFKGTDYLYTLLRGYYRDNSTATGWNNIAYPNIGMPHIFWARQGAREATLVEVHRHTDAKTGQSGFVRTTTVFDAAGNATRTEAPVQPPVAEGLSYSFRPADPQQARQFDSDAADLVAFLAFITDPSAASRVRIGVWVMLFLALFTLVAWRLNSVYWKNIK
jgi:ubiquinol-cytochrome c reductase cytochrome c1 subunit